MVIAFCAGMTAIWTCPFCPLLCDDQPATAPDCALARAALTQALAAPEPPRVDGVPATLDEALAAAAARLGRSRQPLLGGWGTDVAGARALYRLACATGAISDAAGGEALTQTLRVLQDHGGYATTLAEIHQHADLIVMVGSWAPERAPRLLNRVLGGRTDFPTLVHLGDSALAPQRAQVGADSLPVQPVALAGDLFETVARLHLLVTGRAPPGHTSPADLTDLAARLQAARYAVLVWEPTQLGPHGALVIERLQRVIGHLNQTTRAAGFPLGGAQGGGTAQQVHTWLSGLPLRTRVGPRGLEHDPLRHDGARLMAAGDVDLAFWVASYPGMAVPPPGLPRIVLGLPALAGELGDERDTVFIPVATPGVQSGGHLIRADGVITMPLHAMTSGGLPTVAWVVARLLGLLQSQPQPAVHEGSPA